MSLFDPAVAVLHSILMLLAAHLPGPAPLRLAAAIALVTVAVRTLLLPLSVHSYRGQRARASLAPQIEVLRKRHHGDRARLSREIQQLHQSAGVSPFAGIGASLVTLPVVMTLFRMVNILGSPLGTHWLPLLAAGGSATGAALALLVALLAVAWVSSRQQPDGPIVVRVMPFGTVAFAVAAPLAVGVYLLSSTAWTVAERAILPRLA